MTTGIHPSKLPVDVLLRDCTIARVRRSGPGGQHRNKVETGVVIEHSPTGIRAEASERRSQQQNKRTAIFRLRVRLAVMHRVPVAANAEPDELWRSRCRGRRIIVSAEHDNFPALLATAIDVVSAHDFNLRAAAEWLDCSPTQLANLLKLDASSWTAVNTARDKRDLPRLR